MTAPASIPLIILSASREPVEAVNGILRRAGQPTHCTWIPALPDLADALAQINPELLLLVGTDRLQAEAVARVRDQASPDVPLIAIAESPTEDTIVEAMQRGARDVVSLDSPRRLAAVMMRELRAARLERALNSTLQSARDYRHQLETVLEQSNDAVAHVQEGICVDLNDSWLALFGLKDRNALVGQPFMDLFDVSSHAALKGALAATLRGKWPERAIAAIGLLPGGRPINVDILMSVGDHEGEPSVRLIVPASRRDENQLANELADAVRRDPATGFLHRRALLEGIRERIATPASGGVRHIVQVRIDKFAAIEKEVGIEGSEQILIEFASLLRTQVSPKDIAGRFGGVSFVLLLERGNARDAEAWCEQFVERVHKHVFHVGTKSLTISCSAGLGPVPHARPDLDGAMDDALEGCRKARQRGGNQVCIQERADADNRVQAYDQVWVKHIKAALMENRFRLVQQPIASLQGDDLRMVDLLIRMIDHHNKEVLPSEFMPAAERNDLLKNIDRWVVGASLAFAAQKKPGCMFVRLSRDSVMDKSLPDWIAEQVRHTKVMPGRVCFQVTEEVASQHQVQVMSLAQELQERGLRFALERFGSGRVGATLLAQMPLDFVKIDGALVQGLAANEETQAHVRGIVELCGKRNIHTIAERVEDANTMAVLWQLGVQFVQGYFVNEPEEVVMG